MASMVPYDRYGRAIGRSFPFDSFFDDFFNVFNWSCHDVASYLPCLCSVCLLQCGQYLLSSRRWAESFLLLTL